MDPHSIAALAATLRELDARSFADDGEGVWSENWSTVQAFLAVSLQWRVVSIGGGGAAGMGGAALAPMVPMFIGLDYSAVRAGLEAEGMVITPDLWRGLRIMETAACAALNESYG
jgi:hypothetical protein